MNLHNQHTIKAKLINGKLVCNGKLGYCKCPNCEAIHKLNTNIEIYSEKQHIIIIVEKCKSCRKIMSIEAELILIQAVFEVEVKGG